MPSPVASEQSLTKLISGDQLFYHSDDKEGGHRVYCIPLGSSESLEDAISGWCLVHTTWWTPVTECGPRFPFDIPAGLCTANRCQETVCSREYLELTLPPLPGHPSVQDVELILYSEESYSLEIKEKAHGWVWKAPKGLSVVNANWQESPTERATGRGNSPRQHPGWLAYVWLDIFRHCAGFLSQYLCLAAGIDMAKF